jgi:hypothetical protein
VYFDHGVSPVSDIGLLTSRLDLAAGGERRIRAKYHLIAGGYPLADGDPIADDFSDGYGDFRHSTIANTQDHLAVVTGCDT